MAKRKTERLLNLTIALLTSRRYVTRTQLRDAIEGYDLKNDAAFGRQFERDKDDLRSLGIPIITGHNDVWFEDEPGYRIARADFELPPIDFTADELTALGVAANTWQNSIVSDATSGAITKLKAGGVEPDAERLGALAPHVGAKEPAFEPLWSAVVTRRRVRFGYRSEQRSVEPWQLFSRRGSWYLIGFDTDRLAPRAFKLARFTAHPAAYGNVSAFTRPDPEQVRAHVERLQPAAADKVALLAIRHDGAPELRRRGSAAVADDVVPESFELYEVAYATDDDLVADVCAAGADAVLLRPDDLRQRVIARLTEVAGGAR